MKCTIWNNMTLLKKLWCKNFHYDIVIIPNETRVFVLGWYILQVVKKLWKWFYVIWNRLVCCCFRYRWTHDDHWRIIQSERKTNCLLIVQNKTKKKLVIYYLFNYHNHSFLFSLCCNMKVIVVVSHVRRKRIVR